MLLCLSCKNSNVETFRKEIILRVFNFVSNKYELINAEIEIVKNENKSTFIYSFDKKKDTLEFIGNDIYFKGQKITEIDTKPLSINGETFNIKKVFFQNKNDFRGNKYLFINEQLGLIFIHDSYGNMYEFDKIRFHNLSKIVKEISYQLESYTDNDKISEIKQN